MADTKKSMHNDNKSAKPSKEEIPKVSSSKPMSNNADSKANAKTDKKTSLGHSM